MSEHVLIVGVPRGAAEVPGRLRQAGGGVTTSVICRLDHLPKLMDQGAHKRVLALRADAPDDEWIALAAAAHTRDPFTRIVTLTEYDQHRCAAIGAALDLWTYCPRTVELVHDKAAMRGRLTELGIDDTPYAVCPDLAGLRTFVERNGVPCIVKPADGAGSAGVTLVRDVSQLPGAFSHAAGANDPTSDHNVLIERFHAGPQFSVEAFSEDGVHEVVAITRKYSDPVTFVELGHVTPAELPTTDYTMICEFVHTVLDALGVTFGPTHTEIVLQDVGPRLIETHVRMGGDSIASLVRDATGVDLADCVIQQTLGREVLPTIRAQLSQCRSSRYSAIWFAATTASGRLDRISGVHEASLMTGVTDVHLLAQPGDRLDGIKDSGSRLAYARAAGSTADAAVTAARDAVARLAFHLEVRAAEAMPI